MTPHDALQDARVYAGLGGAIRSREPVTILPRVGGDAAQVAAGVAVYRNNVRAAYLRALRETFPVTERLVGEEFFRYLAHEYFHACPPASPLVARYGDALPEFLGRFEPAAKVPYLADVARLELAWLSAYHAAEGSWLSPGEIFEAAGVAPERARLTLHPSVRLVSSKYPIHSIWMREREGRSDNLRLADTGEHVIVVRPSHKVVASAVSTAAATALSAIEAGARLGDALDAALERDPTAQISEILQFIATARVVAAVTINSECLEGEDHGRHPLI